MASRISKLFSSKPIKKSSLNSENDKNNADSNISLIPSPIIETKKDYSTEWTICSCCLKELHQNHQNNCVPTSPKNRQCESCQGCICKHCREKGICHECIVRREIKLDPDAMMELDDDKLRQYIFMLHYPPGGFQNCPKPYLVKQILVRFKMFENWDPKLLVSPVSELVPAPVPRLSEDATSEISTSEISAEVKLRDHSQKKKHSDRAEILTTSAPAFKVPIIPRPIQTDVILEETDAEISQQHQKVLQAEVEKAVRRREERQQRTESGEKRASSMEKSKRGNQSLTRRYWNLLLITAKLPMWNLGSKLLYQPSSVRSTDSDSRPIPPSGEEPKRLSDNHHHYHSQSLQNSSQKAEINPQEPDIIELQSLKSIEDIKLLRKKHLKRILREANVDIKSLSGTQDYQHAVIHLWNYSKSKSLNGASRTSKSIDVDDKPIREHKQLHRLQYRNSAAEPSTSFDKQNHQPRSISLKDFPATSFTEQLSIEQLCEILIYHNLNPEEYKDREDMQYAVICLWHAIKRGSILPKIIGESNKRPKKLELNVDQTQVPIEQLTSPIDIEKLNPFQMKNILASHNVDPSQYRTDAELFLKVVDVWSGVKEEMEKMNEKPIENGHSHRTEAATGKFVSKWLNQHDNKAPLALVEDITFIDDEEASDYDAINCDDSSESDKF